jgi:predicted HicB family RNase H-like nuclease
LLQDLSNSVEEYLALCTRNGTQPEKPYKGSFNVRIGADLHRKTAFLAHAKGISLNELVEDAIRHSVNLFS